MSFEDAVETRRFITGDPYFTEMCCGTEAGSYLRLIDSCITQLKDLLGPVTRVTKKKKDEL